MMDLCQRFEQVASGRFMSPLCWPDWDSPTPAVAPRRVSRPWPEDLDLPLEANDTWTVEAWEKWVAERRKKINTARWEPWRKAKIQAANEALNCWHLYQAPVIRAERQQRHYQSRLSRKRQWQEDRKFWSRVRLRHFQREREQLSGKLP